MAELKPMQVGEVLDGAFTVYRRHFGLFLKLSVAVMWLPFALAVYFRLRFGGATAEEVITVLSSGLLSFMLLGLVFVVIYGVAALLLQAGTIHVISASYLGHDPRLGDALALGRSRIVPLLLVGIAKFILVCLISLVGGLCVVALTLLARSAGSVLAGLVAVVGAAALVWFIPFVLCAYGVTAPVVVLEDLTSSFDAFRRSWALTRSFKLKVLGLMLIAVLLADVVPPLIVSLLTGWLALQWPVLWPAVVTINALVPLVLAPIVPCILTLLYYDLRVRREAFDLQVLGARLGIL